MPVIGFLDSRSSDAMGSRLAVGFAKVSKKLGFAEGENVAVAYRWAEDRLRPSAGDGRRAGEPAAHGNRHNGRPYHGVEPAKAATTTIPIVFLVGEDPTRLGLVGSVARPSGNLTGINLFANELEAKRLELLHQLCRKPSVLPSSLTRPM